jgi:hypothetical protein
MSTNRVATPEIMKILKKLPAQFLVEALWDQLDEYPWDDGMQGIPGQAKNALGQFIHALGPMWLLREGDER